MQLEASRREAMGGIVALALLARKAAAAPPARTVGCPTAVPLDNVAHRLLAHTPETATFHGVAEALNGGPLARRMDDYSPAGEAAWREALKDGLTSLSGLSCPADRRGALRLEVARAVLANAARSAGVRYGRINAFGFSGHVPYLVNQIGGPAIDSPACMQVQQSVATPAAVGAWIEKLHSFEPGMAGVIETLRADEAAGCRPPRIILEEAKAATLAFLDGEAGVHPLILALRQRMADVALDARFRRVAEEQAITALERSVRPAYLRLAEQLEAMIPRGRSEAGVWAQPDGEELYAANVRALGDTAMAPAAIHAIGLDEVKRIQGRMDTLLRQQGLARGSIGARMQTIARNPRNRFADSEQGRAAMLDYVRAHVRAMEARYLEILPAAMIPRQVLDVRRVPVAIEAGAPSGSFDAPARDGSRSGTYWLNLRDMAAIGRFQLPTLSYHEGVPGHHTQASVALALGEVPVLIRIASFNAYQEGWALYAERLTAEMGAYRDDRLGDLGRLQAELFRASRLVVDTGLHALRWKRERAIAYLRVTTGIAESKSVAEVERYMAWPGQALGYKLGEMRLLALRRQMRARLGRRFRRSAFHARVLGQGAMPLDLLEREVLRP